MNSKKLNKVGVMALIGGRRFVSQLLASSFEDGEVEYNPDSIGIRGLHPEYICQDEPVVSEENFMKHMESGRGIIVMGAGSENAEFVRNISEEEGLHILPFNSKVELVELHEPKLNIRKFEPLIIPSFFVEPESRRDRRARERKNKKKR